MSSFPDIPDYRGILLGGGQSAQSRRVYRATPKGHEAMAAAKVKVCELFSELLEDEGLGSGLPRRLASARGLMKSLVIESRAGVG
jgi:DNA-binding PadR family transcriptional regulator